LITIKRVKMAASLAEYCMNGDIEGARNAIESGADINSRSLEGKTPLMYAMWNNQNSVVELLMQNDNLDVNCEDSDGATALHHAVDVDNDEGVRMLLADPRLQDINHKNRRGLTPLMRAVARSKVNCTRLLLSDKRVDLDTRDNYKRSPQELKRAVTVEQRPISKVLLDGLYDAECPLSQLRGCQHVMKMIWEEVAEHKRHAVAKLGRTVEEVVATTPSLWGTGLSAVIKEAKERNLS